MFSKYCPSSSFFQRNFKITSLDSSQKIPLGSICIGTALYLGICSFQAETQHCFYSHFLLYLREVVDLLTQVTCTLFNIVLRYFILHHFVNQIFSFIFSIGVLVLCKIVLIVFCIFILYLIIWFKLCWQLFIGFSWVFYRQLYQLLHDYFLSSSSSYFIKKWASLLFLILLVMSLLFKIMMLTWFNTL